MCMDMEWREYYPLHDKGGLTNSFVPLEEADGFGAFLRCADHSQSSSGNFLCSLGECDWSKICFNPSDEFLLSLMRPGPLSHAE